MRLDFCQHYIRQSSRYKAFDFGKKMITNALSSLKEDFLADWNSPSTITLGSSNTVIAFGVEMYIPLVKLKNEKS